MIDAIDAMLLDDLAQLGRRAEDRDAVQLLPQLLGLRVDESDEIDPVLGMLEQLAPDQLADVPSPDDHGVLDVSGPTARDCPHDTTVEHDERDRGRPEPDQLPRIRRLRQEPGGQEGDPRSNGHEVEDLRHLVDRRVIRVSLVAGVKAVDPRGDEPRRQREQVRMPLSAVTRPDRRSAVTSPIRSATIRSRQSSRPRRAP